MQKGIILFSAIFSLFLAACQAAESVTTATPATPIFALPQAATKPAVTSTQGPIVFPKIDRHPSAANFGRGALTELPDYDPASDEYWQVDLRGYDLSNLDLRNSLDDLMFASFDDRTVWPATEMMPEKFDWRRIMDLGKIPGFSSLSLRAEGITGKNIGVAIIDQILLVDHQEYSEQLRFYEEEGSVGSAAMHGAAVASIAVGKNVGIAPEADLYFIANDMCHPVSIESIDFSCLAKSVRRIIEVNSQLPADRKIRVLSMSIGWGSDSKGYNEITAAVQAARDAGIFIICSSESEIYGLSFHGLGRLPMADPENANSYEPGFWWAKYFYGGQTLTKTLLVPMDSRTTASPTGVEEYVFYREGGWSWSIPYIAGVYALAAQVKPDITPEVFWSTALDTGRTIEISHGGKTYSFGVILDPVALIHALQKA
jgi:subtilisin family serine protease